MRPGTREAKAKRQQPPRGRVSVSSHAKSQCWPKSFHPGGNMTEISLILMTLCCNLTTQSHCKNSASSNNKDRKQYVSLCLCIWGSVGKMWQLKGSASPLSISSFYLSRCFIATFHMSDHNLWEWGCETNTQWTVWEPIRPHTHTQYRHQGEEGHPGAVGCINNVCLSHCHLIFPWHAGG